MVWELNVYDGYPITVFFMPPEFSLGFTKVIQGVKDNSDLQVSCQEPFMSSKYPHQGRGSWHTFNHARLLTFGTQVGNTISRTIKMSRRAMSLVRNPQCPVSHWGWWGGSWHTSNIARKLKFGTQVGNHVWKTFKMSWMTCVLHFSCQEPLKSTKLLIMTEVLYTLLIMLDTKNLAHMFGVACDHDLLGRWAEGSPKPSTGSRMEGA